MHKGGRDVIAAAACCRRGSWAPAVAVPPLLRRRLRRLRLGRPAVAFSGIFRRGSVRASDVFIWANRGRGDVSGDNAEMR